MLNQILGTTRDEIHNTYHLLTDRYAPLSRFLADIHAPPLNVLAPATEFVLNSELRKQFENGHLDVERVRSLLAEGQANKIIFESDTLAYAFKRHLDRLSEEFVKNPDDLEVLQRLSNSAGLLRTVPFEVNLWKPQNIYYRVAAGLSEKPPAVDEKSRAWAEKFKALGEQLGFKKDLNPAGS